jgi:hypothetical protein
VVKPKDLSVNNSDFTPTDDGRSQADEGLVALRKFLIADQELAKAVEPGVCGFNHPSAILWGATPSSFLPTNTRGVPPVLDGLLSGFTVVSFVCVKEGVRSAGPFNDNGLQQGNELGHVMPVCSGYDQGQRDTTRVDQQVALASIFFPDPSGLARRRHGPRVP